MVLKYCFFLILVAPYQCDHPKLNLPRILLPFNLKYPTNFTLHADKGCYKWWSSSPSVATVVLLDKKCENRVVINAVSTRPSRSSAIIFAQDISSGHIIKCDIIVDRIVSINIKTTTRKLFLEDAPEIFEVLAQNDQNDTFSSIDGMEFQWIISSETSSSIISISSFENSSYETPQSIIEMERANKRGYMVLIEAHKTGTAKIITKLSDNFYKDVVETSVDLSIIANLIIEPSDEICVQQYSSLNIKVYQLKHSKLHEILFTDADQYYLTLWEDQSPCTLDKLTSLVKTNALGLCTLTVRDKNAINDQNMPQLIIHVVRTSYMKLKIEPGSLWVLEVGRTYRVTVELYDDSGHQIWPTDDLRIQIDMDSAYITIHNSTLNGTIHQLTPKKKGAINVKATFKSIFESTWKTISIAPITQEQEIEIFDAIKVFPSRIVVPYDPIAKATYTVQFEAHGGSGHYMWRTTNSTVAVVSNDGLVSIKSCLGNVTVVASDIRNPVHIATGKVLVMLPKSIDFSRNRVETFMSDNLILYINLFGSMSDDETNRDIVIPFTNCDKMALNVTIKDPSIFEIIDSAGVLKVDNSCRSITLKALKQGSTQITVSYVSRATQTNIRSTITIASYQRLEILDPRDTLLTLGSSKVVVLAYGPKPWYSDPTGFYKNVIETTDEKSGSGLRIQESTEFYSLAFLHHYEVTCLELGNWSLGFQVGNNPSTFNVIPLNDSISIRMRCSEPAKVNLKPLLQVPAKNVDGITLPDCPLLQITESVLPHMMYRDLEVSIEMVDEAGNVFYNFSSLLLTWSVSDESLGLLELNTGFLEREAYSANMLSHEFSDKLKPNVKSVKNFQIFHPFQKEGVLDITIHVGGYRHDLPQIHKSLHNIGLLSSFHELRNQLRLKLVKEVELIPPTITLLNHHSTVANLDILYGSGYYYIDSGQGDRPKSSHQHSHSVAEVHYTPLSPNTIMLTPTRVGRLVISLYDMCFERTDPTKTHVSSIVTVTGIHRIEVVTNNKVEFGKDVIAQVHLRDSDGNAFNFNFLPGLNIKPIVENPDIISVKTMHRSIVTDAESLPHEVHSQWHQSLMMNDSIKFVIHGKGVGVSNLRFAVNLLDDDTVIYSQTMDMKVFPSLVIEPSNLTLIPGASFQVKTLGGPPFHSSITYELSDTGVANVTEDGLVTGFALGEITLTVKFTGYTDPDNADAPENHYFCQATSHIRIVALTKVHLYAPLKSIYAGHEMPLIVHGAEDANSFFTFASRIPCFRVEWETDDPQLSSIISPFLILSNIGSNDQNDFRKTFRALKPGHVKVTVRITKIFDTCQVKETKNWDRSFHLSNLIPTAHREHHTRQHGGDIDFGPTEFKESLMIEIIEPFQLIPSNNGITQSSLLIDTPNNNDNNKHSDGHTYSHKSSSVILMSVNSEIRIMTRNREDRWSKITYDLRQLTGVEIDVDESQAYVSFDSTTGLIRTTDYRETSPTDHNHHNSLYYGSALLTANTWDSATETNHTSYLIIQIKPISYIMLVPMDPIPSSNPLPYFPIGTSVNFAVRYHDDTGAVFDAVSSKIKYNLNRFDKIEITYPYTNEVTVSSNILINFNRPGTTLLEIMSQHTTQDHLGRDEQLRRHGIDYLTIEVGPVIEVCRMLHPNTKKEINLARECPLNPSSLPPLPREKLVVGEVFCASTPLISLEGIISGPWLTDSQLIFIQPYYGFGVALANGSNRIIYQSAKNRSTFKEIDIIPIEGIQFLVNGGGDFFIKDELLLGQNPNQLSKISYASADRQFVNATGVHLSNAIPRKIFSFPFVTTIGLDYNTDMLTYDYMSDPSELDHRCLLALNKHADAKKDIVTKLNEIYTCKLKWDHVDQTFSGEIDNLFETIVDLDESGIYTCKISSRYQEPHSIYKSLHSNVQIPSKVSLELGFTNLNRETSFMGDNKWQPFGTIDNDFYTHPTHSAILRDIPFYPPFYLETTMIFLSASQTDTLFKIRTSKVIMSSLKFVPSVLNTISGDIIEIYPPELDPNNQNSAIFPVRLNPNSPLYALSQRDIAYSIDVYTPLTGQKEILLINIKWSEASSKMKADQRYKPEESTQSIGHMIDFVIQNPQLSLYWIALIVLTTFGVIFGWYITHSDPQMTLFFGPVVSPQSRSVGMSPHLNRSFPTNLSPVNYPNIPNATRLSPLQARSQFIPSERKVYPSKLWSLGRSTER